MTMTTSADIAVAARSVRNHEEGYKALLVREETKKRLAELRSSLQDRDTYLERRLVTAAIEMVMQDAKADPLYLDRWQREVRQVVRKDMDGLER